MASTALKLVQVGESGPQEGGPQKAARSAVERVFDHWVLMMGKSAARCALGQARVKVISAALQMYDEEVLLLAIEGCAASAFHNGANDRGESYNDLSLILRNESYIERFAEKGEHARASAQRAHVAQQREQAEQSQETPSDAAKAAEARERIRAWCAQRRGGR